MIRIRTQCVRIFLFSTLRRWRKIAVFLEKEKGLCYNNREKGGGIMAIVPRQMGIGVYSPALDKKGNSVAGNKLLERLSQTLGLSIF